MAVLIALLLTIPLAGCATTAPKKAGPDLVITLVDDAFQPASARVPVDGLIQFENKGSHTHAIIPNETPIGTADIAPGGIGQLRFGHAGVHWVHCKYMPNMTMPIETYA